LFALEDDGDVGQEFDGVFDVGLEGGREWNGEAIEAMGEHEPADFDGAVTAAMNDGEEGDVGAELEDG
jgi:hypothetical protein